ncbi:unnamed protein product [Ilex paraguariensis]|uniref:Uncharacterized protein n=1 Tax=Ilex paraguariensis TaxID=185542 RepID=A0ABC8R124_9AQUA
MHLKLLKSVIEPQSENVTLRAKAAKMELDQVQHHLVLQPLNDELRSQENILLEKYVVDVGNEEAFWRQKSRIQ